jgi:hypothetical protein
VGHAPQLEVVERRAQRRLRLVQVAAEEPGEPVEDVRGRREEDRAAAVGGVEHDRAEADRVVDVGQREPDHRRHRGVGPGVGVEH